MSKEIKKGEESDYKNPGYWNEHGFFDGCSPMERKGEFDWKAYRFAEDSLKEFLGIQTRREAHSRIDTGQEFNAYQYSPGTIVRFQTEKYFDMGQIRANDYSSGSALGLSVTPTLTGINEYERKLNWGVVTPLTKNSLERTLMFFQIIDDPTITRDRLFPIQHSRPEALTDRFQVGEVYHWDSRLLIRPEWLEIVKLGGGIKTPMPTIKRTIVSRFLPKPVTG